MVVQEAVVMMMKRVVVEAEIEEVVTPRTVIEIGIEIGIGDTMTERGIGTGRGIDIGDEKMLN